MYNFRMFHYLYSCQYWYGHIQSPRLIYSHTLTNIGIFMYNYQYWYNPIQLPILVCSYTITNIGIFIDSYQYWYIHIQLQDWYLHIHLPILVSSYAITDIANVILTLLKLVQSHIQTLRRAAPSQTEVRVRMMFGISLPA